MPRNFKEIAPSWIRLLYCTWIFEQSMGDRNRVGKGVVVPARQATQAGGIDSLESILGLLTCLKIWAPYTYWISSRAFCRYFPLNVFLRRRPYSQHNLQGLHQGQEYKGNYYLGRKVIVNIYIMFTYPPASCSWTILPICAYILERYCTYSYLLGKYCAMHIYSIFYTSFYSTPILLMESTLEALEASRPWNLSSFSWNQEHIHLPGIFIYSIVSCSWALGSLVLLLGPGKSRLSPGPWEVSFCYWALGCLILLMGPGIYPLAPGPWNILSWSS